MELERLYGVREGSANPKGIVVGSSSANGTSPERQFTESELASWGANIIIYANHMLRASYPAMQKVAETILKAERSLEVNDMCMPIKQILELIPGTK